MADLVNRVPGIPVVRSTGPWGAIWAGVFSFAAIWAIFGMLGAAIFSSTGNMGSPMSGADIGMGIWSIVLTMIAMYVGGRVTGYLAGTTNRSQGLVYGMTMFGLAVISALLIVVLRLAAGHIAATVGPHIPAITPAVGWFGFIALFLGWLCAIAGASSGRPPESQGATVREMRTAA